MNIKYLIFGLIHQLSLIDLVYGACSNIATRKELRQLSGEELNRFLTATKKLHEKMDTYNWFVDIHNRVDKKAHGVPAFLPWHRAFLKKYEKELQKIDSRVVLPYWDWSIDSKNAEQSQVLSNRMMGGNGDSSTGCVMDGVAANWKVRIPEDRCLKRGYSEGNKVGRLTSKDEMETIFQSGNSYTDFKDKLEGGPHNSVHRKLGENNSDMGQMWSPNDPIFMMHHCFIDKMWFEWQMRDTKRLNEYARNGASMDDDLWQMGTKVKSVMNTRSDGYCYQYERYGSPNTQKSLEESPLMADQMTAKSDSTIWERIRNMPMSALLEKNISRDGQKIGNDTKLSLPDRIPENSIKMFNLNHDIVEENFQFLTKIVMILNANPNFKPDTSL